MTKGGHQKLNALGGLLGKTKSRQSKAIRDRASKRASPTTAAPSVKEPFFGDEPRPASEKPIAKPKPPEEAEETSEKLRSSLDSSFQQMRASYMRYQKAPKKENVGTVGRGRFIIRNLWDVCCTEVESEVNELDQILKRFGLPSMNYTKMKMYDIHDYELVPDLATCKVKDFLDFYVFPYLLPALQALIQFARVNRVFQCRFCTFNALDYIVEYLHNNNPRHPERLKDPVPLFDIPFCKDWLEKYPRKPPPKWMLMSSEEAAIIIQRAVRGWMVRCRQDVQEMRQFWREIRKDLEEERMIREFGRTLADSPPTALNTPYYEEYYGELEENPNEMSFYPEPPYHEKSPPPEVAHHSDNCIYCQAFRQFLETQPEEIIKSYQRRTSSEGNGLSPSGSAKTMRTNSGNLSAGKNGEATDSTLEAAMDEMLEHNSKRKDSLPPPPPPATNETLLPSFSNSKSIKPNKAISTKPQTASPAKSVKAGKPGKKTID